MEKHIMIEDIQPMIGWDHYLIKCVVNEPWQVEVAILRDGHDIIRTALQP